ncbi:MAG: HAMP domain-containing sensor histidine kinase [Candidatus Gracilibacteria bacterium]|nr:HAMP domain-containing sensor histidine kinase [Candidatus Gracilibacteria bacterium]
MTSSSLSKQKHRLATLFSLSIFAITVVLDIGFISFKYFDYEKQETNRLSFQAQGIARIVKENPLFLDNMLQGKEFNMPLPTNPMRRPGGNNDGAKPGDRSKIQMENFFIYHTQTNKILFSPQKNDEAYLSILKEVKEQGPEGETRFRFNESEYVFVNIPIGLQLSVVVFTETRITNESMVFDLLIYLLGAIVLSLGVYIVSYRFVDDTLSPVEKSMEQMEQFIHNAGHELKTPISVIKSSLELMRLKKNYEEGISESIGELNRMDGLIQALIRLSTMGDTEIREPVNIPEIFEKLEKNYREKLDEKGIHLQVIQKKHPQIRANREYAEILFSNILGNAIKYNRDNGSIIVTIDQKKITIEDTGIGIAPENLEKIFDRFYQENESRTVDSFGIGLSLVARIAALYKWHVSVESTKGVGTIVKVEF